MPLRTLLARVLLLTALSLLPWQLAPGQEVGRLFLTPAERDYLERLRIEDNEPQPVLPVAEPEPESEAMATEPEVVIYAHGGTLRSADGNYTVWLNDRAYSRDELPDNVELLSPYSRGQLRISASDGSRSFLVKPGQVLNLTNGQVYENYAASQHDQVQEDSQSPEQEL